MKRTIVALVLAHVLLMLGLAGYVLVAVPGPCATEVTMVPTEPPMSRLAGLAP